MPVVSKDSGSHAKHNELGPNYFGYYKHAILELFSENEAVFSPSAIRNLESSMRQNANVKIGEVSNSNSSIRKVKECASASLFSGGIGAGLSDSQRERMKTFLKQSAIDVNYEVNEILDHILTINKIQALLSVKKPELCCFSESVKDEGEHLSKKQKRSLSHQSDFTQKHVGSDGSQSSKVETGNDFLALSKGTGLQSRETLKKTSDDLSTKLVNMEQQLEEFLDVIMSKCRVMTQAEKQQLRRRIQNLPMKARDRVVQIIRHRKPSGDLSCDEIHVVLDNEENVTLWRLHYYVEVVERENRLKAS